jgi:hypothetical protein
MEKPLNETELNDVFLDVRKSYRLLYLYQRRVMDLVKFIGNHYGFQYERGEQYFLNPPASWKSIHTNHWSWDFLLMNNHVFVFKPKKLGDYEEVRLMINIVSDTGFYDNEEIHDKRKIKDYSDVDKAATQIHLILKTKGLEWKKTYPEKYVPKQVIAPLNNTEVLKERKKVLIAKKYDLSDFMNEESTLEQLKDFEGFCNENKIVLRPNVKDGIAK